METIKIYLHSSVDLITNSSTVIFTYSEGSLGSVKELVNEMLKVFGYEGKTFDDFFYAETFIEDDYNYSKERCGFGFPKGIKDEKTFIKEIKLKVLKGEIEKPEWMINAEEYDGYYDGFNFPTVLEILPKSEEYAELANKLLNYLYSTEHDGTRNS